MAPNLAVSFLLYIWYQRSLAAMGIFDRGYTAHGLEHVWNLLMVNPLAFWLYLGQIFLHSRLTVFYTWPALKPVYSLGQIAVALGTIVAICAAGVWLFRRRKDLFFYYSAFFVLMVPYLNLLYIGIWVAERYAYFSSFCLVAIVCSVAGAALRHANRAARISALTACAVMLALNAFQTLSSQRVWRSAETLWQYHITLPHPASAAYENLAAYYYALACEHPDAASMALPVKKMSIVVESGLAELWPDRNQPPPPTTSHLFFLKSIIEELTGKPEEALASLLPSDRLRPGFDATNLKLARVYRKLSGIALDPKQRRGYSCAAPDPFLEDVRLALRGRPAPP